MKLDPQLINATQKMLHEGAIALMCEPFKDGTHRGPEEAAQDSFAAYEKVTILLGQKIADEVAKEE